MELQMNPELQFGVAELAALIPSRSLSSLPAKKIEGETFKFIKAVMPTNNLTPEEQAAIDADPVEALKAKLFIYSGAGTTIGIRANSLLGLHMLKKNAADVAAAKKLIKKDENHSTIGTVLLEKANEQNIEGKEIFVPQFPTEFKIMAAEPVVLNGNMVYPMQAYTQFDVEVETRQKRFNADVLAGRTLPGETFNISTVFADQLFRNSLRGTEIKKGTTPEPYKSVYINPVY